MCQTPATILPEQPGLASLKTVVVVAVVVVVVVVVVGVVSVLSVGLTIRLVFRPAKCTFILDCICWIALISRVRAHPITSASVPKPQERSCWSASDYK